MIQQDQNLNPRDLQGPIATLWQASEAKIRSLATSVGQLDGSPVHTVNGRYVARGWTEWTQGFVVGSALLQYDATDDPEMLDLGIQATLETMAEHVTHTGVHDHGFNNVSTYGNLWRMTREGRLEDQPWRTRFVQMALKASAAVQASRWTDLPDDLGYIYSFNGPHSLFADTIRSCRILALGHKLQHVLKGEGDRAIGLLGRMLTHMRTTARYTVFYGEGRDIYDEPGRVVHECIFNLNDGAFRCPSSQQGYSPFTTWTRGLAWIMLGMAEELEFLATLDLSELDPFGGREAVTEPILRAARVTCDFYLRNTPTDGVCYWDTGAPGLARMGDYLQRPADPFNDHEPVDSSAAAIAAQGLLRLARVLEDSDAPAATRYQQAGLVTARTLLSQPYLSTDPDHQGLLLHSVYHRPNGWDHIPDGARVPCREAAMWGDYHLRELALYLQRLIDEETYLTFFGPV
jgi:unsaturated chondroitin disaccharide hydrolase